MLPCETLNFDGNAAVEGNRAFVAEQGAGMAERTGIEFVDVIDCQVAFDHLRVPEEV